MLRPLQHGKRSEARSIPGLSRSDNTLFLYPDYYYPGRPTEAGSISGCDLPAANAALALDPAVRTK